MVSRKLIEELKIIIKEDYGRDLDIKTITQMAEDMVGFYDTLAKIYFRMNNNLSKENNYGKL